MRSCSVGNDFAFGILQRVQYARRHCRVETAMVGFCAGGRKAGGGLLSSGYRRVRGGHSLDKYARR